jgi:hypothetical protein
MFVGALLDFLGVTGPIHELGHLIGATLDGHRAWIDGWLLTMIEGQTYVGAYAGAWFEVIVYSALTLLWLRRHPRAAGLAFGAAHLTVLISPFSGDFTSQIERMYPGDTALLMGGILCFLSMSVFALGITWAVVDRSKLRNSHSVTWRKKGGS